VVLPLWVVKNRPSPLLWPLAYTTACTTVQAVITLLTEINVKLQKGDYPPAHHLNVNVLLSKYHLFVIFAVLDKGKGKDKCIYIAHFL